jgi:hypothetical protein
VDPGAEVRCISVRDVAVSCGGNEKQRIPALTTVHHYGLPSTTFPITITPPFPPPSLHLSHRHHSTFPTTITHPFVGLCRVSITTDEFMFMKSYSEFIFCSISVSNSTS